MTDPLVVPPQAAGFDAVARHRARLLSIQGLLPEDLGALYAGQVPPRVSARIATAASRVRIMAWIITALCPMVLGVAVLQSRFTPEQSVSLGGVSIGWVAVLAPVVLLIAIGLHRKAGRIAAEQGAPLLYVEGELSRGRTASSRNKRIWIDVGGDHFEHNDSPLVDDLWQHVLPGKPARAYVTGGSRMLVLIEPLPAPDCALTRG